MRIILCASQEIGVKCLDTLLNLKQEVPLVITYKPEYYERWEYDLGGYAKEKGLSVEYTRKIENEPFITLIKSIKPDWILLAGWRDIVPDNVYAIPKLGAANIHSTCLPEGKGFSPYNWSILLGLKTTGVTLFKLDEGIDTGFILAQKKGIPIDERETYGSLAKKMIQPAVELVKEVVISLDSNKPLPTIKTGSKESYYARRVPQDSEIDWNDSAIVIDRLVRASNPAPLAYTFLRTQRDGIKKVFIRETQLPPWEIGPKEVYAENIYGVPGNWLGVNTEGVAFLTGVRDRILIKKISLETDRNTIINALDYKPFNSSTARLGKKCFLME